MMEVVLIRHGMTNGNLEKRYIGGRTDEPLCTTGRERLCHHSYPEVDAVIVSPMLRCIETASLIYPDYRVIEEEKFRECDFGAFEGFTAKELEQDPRYQEWINSMGTAAFPGGEDPEKFQQRCRTGFLEVLEFSRRLGFYKVAIICHGGTIMSVMSSFAKPKKDYFDFQVKNGEGYVLSVDQNTFNSSHTRISYRSDHWRSSESVSSDSTDGEDNCRVGTNFKKLFSED